MDRSEAVALLRGLVDAHVVQPSLASLVGNAYGSFDLLIKADCNPIDIIRYIVEKDLPLIVNSHDGMCRIHKLRFDFSEEYP